MDTFQKGTSWKFQNKFDSFLKAILHSTWYLLFVTVVGKKIVDTYLNKQ